MEVVVAEVMNWRKIDQNKRATDVCDVPRPKKTEQKLDEAVLAFVLEKGSGTKEDIEQAFNLKPGRGYGFMSALECRRIITVIDHTRWEVIKKK